MLQVAAKNLFLASVFAILSLNHVTLGYCHCFESLFISDCGCHEGGDLQHEEDDCCDSGHSCDHCPCTEGEDCSTWVCFELEQFTGQVEAELIGPLFTLEPANYCRAAIPFPILQGSIRARWYDTTGPPLDQVPIRLRFSVFLI